MTRPIETNSSRRSRSGSSGDARAAVDAAVEAQDRWAATSAHDRGAVLRETATILSDRKDELGELLTRELGKTIDSSRSLMPLSR